ncbi:hypothetical protein TELCIR_13765 [Teladorsagia circumcincta]|uniref:Uncharacterized protein n=1 Tax=Teladorsagia circumcincta TaxID=45464 RepID=A0A2G9U4I1_TELCI|nr:hypothetical protein TELCIR_13765 [Teladorsagia circumcincta]
MVVVHNFAILGMLLHDIDHFRMNRLSVIRCVSRGFVSAAPRTSTGIEHAEALAKIGGKKPDRSLYKVSEYLNMNKYSFYESEVVLAKHRLQQPSNKRPDVMPKVKTQ